MPQQTTGRAALVASDLPTSKTVSTATNATPIVITTTTAHGLLTNEVFSVVGVTGNSAANGTFIAGTVTSTTVALLTYPAGTSVAGTGAGTGGTLLSAGFGITVPVPTDVTDLLQAASPNVPFEACLDRLAWVAYMLNGNSTIPGNKSFANPISYNPAQSITRNARNHPFVYSGTWTVDTATYRGGYVDSLNTGSQIAWEVDIPHNASLTASEVVIFPNTGHGGVLPTNSPKLTLYRQPFFPGTSVQVATVTDPTFIAGYEQVHFFQMTGSPIAVIDRSANRYLMVLTSESGGSAVAGLEWIALNYTYSVTTIGLD